MPFDNNTNTKNSEIAEQVGLGEQAEGLNLLSLQGDSNISNATSSTTGSRTDDSSTTTASAIFGNLEITNSQSSDNGHWQNDRATEPVYRPSESESAGAEAAQIFANPYASAADRQRAQGLILNSPNPARAVDTANNGYPVTQGGIFRSGRNTDSLSSHGLRLQLDHANIPVPPVGRPEDANYRPGRTDRVPVGVSLIDTRSPLRRVDPRIGSR